MTEESKRKIEALKPCSREDNWCNNCPASAECISTETTTSNWVAKMALEVIDAQDRELEEYKGSLSDSVRVIAELREQLPKWIPVAEGLPEPFVTVLVTHKRENDTPRRHMAHLNPQGRWAGLSYTGEVTAWMPLPEPWEGEV